MLRQRIVTAAVLFLVLGGAFYWLPASAIYPLFCLIGLAAAWEWTRLAGLTAPLPRLAYLLAVAALMAGAGWLAGRGGALWLLGLGSLYWLHALWRLRGFPDAWRDTVGMALLRGVLMIVPATLALGVLHGQGLMVLLLVLLVVWMADIGAYFTGRAIGRRKLAPTVSPGKSIEGALGGLLLAALVVVPLGLHHLALNGTAAVGFVLLVLIAIAASVLGDLVESAAKRIAGVKDSGRLLPGHGGVLDRIDSLLAAAPVFAFGLLLVTGQAGQLA